MWYSQEFVSSKRNCGQSNRLNKKRHQKHADKLYLRRFHNKNQFHETILHNFLLFTIFLPQNSTQNNKFYSFDKMLRLISVSDDLTVEFLNSK